MEAIELMQESFRIAFPHFRRLLEALFVHCSSILKMRDEARLMRGEHILTKGVINVV